MMIERQGEDAPIGLLLARLLERAGDFGIGDRRYGP
jgi:hypothetical protein